MSKELFRLTETGKIIVKNKQPIKTSKGFVDRLYKKIDEIESNKDDE